MKFCRYSGGFEEGGEVTERSPSSKSASLGVTSKTIRGDTLAEKGRGGDASTYFWAEKKHWSFCTRGGHIQTVGGPSYVVVPGISFRGPRLLVSKSACSFIGLESDVAPVGGKKGYFRTKKVLETFWKFVRYSILIQKYTHTNNAKYF